MPFTLTETAAASLATYLRTWAEIADAYSKGECRTFSPTETLAQLALLLDDFENCVSLEDDLREKWLSADMVLPAGVAWVEPNEE